MKSPTYLKNLFIMMFLLLLLPFNYVHAEHKDYSSNHTFANEALEELIEVLAYDDNYDKKEAQAMIDRIAKIPEIILKETVNQGVKLWFIDFPLTDLAEFEDLKGVVPRGWEHTDSTWDDIPGVGGDIAVARIGHSEPGNHNGHGAANLEYHEFTHAVDYYMLGTSISESPEFMQIHQEEKPQMWPDGSADADYLEHVEEYFAETSAIYYLDGNEKKELKKIAPKTYSFIDNLPNRVLNIDEDDPSGILLSWQEIDGADEYEILRDSHVIDIINSNEYIDSNYEEYTLHNYEVKAIDSSGDMINETYVNAVMTSSIDNQSIPTIPGNVTGELLEDFTVMLEWDEEMDEEITYYVLRNDNIISNTDDPYFIDDTIEENKIYEYTIQAENISGISDPSSIITIDTSGDSVQEVNAEQNETISAELIKQPTNAVYFILIGGVILIVGMLLVTTAIVLFFIFRSKKKNS